MFLQRAQSACSYSTWHPQVLLLKKIPLTSPNVQPCQCWSSILRSLPVVVVSRPHCHRLNWALCNRPLHIHFPIKTLTHSIYGEGGHSIVSPQLLWQNLKINITLINSHIKFCYPVCLCIIIIKALISGLYQTVRFH